ncbi:hypothetical protein [Nocardia vinacea]|uniref:hypothetical protein n=1 Tax=Nocardia vinacea TaxID=96468 RepID=UPI000313ADD3|nr:hypothetical protein [Nocardia vinacea]
MRRFLLESHTRTPGVGVLPVLLGADDLDEIVENPRLRALSADTNTEVRIYDRSVELLAVDEFGWRWSTRSTSGTWTARRCA